MKENRFTIGLALFDMIPIIFFMIAMYSAAVKMVSSWFFLAAVICGLAGFGKVLWKIILASTGKDITILAKQFRYLMSVGFLGMVISFWWKIQIRSFYYVTRRFVSMPSLVFFIIGLVALTLMFSFAINMDQMDVKTNWKEEIMNCIAQGAIMIGILLM